MAFPSIHEMQKLFGKLPTFTESHIDAALTAAGRTLPPDTRASLHSDLVIAFKNYFTSRLWDLWAAKAPASQTASKLKRIAATADKLALLLEIVDEPTTSRQRGRLDELYRMCLIAQANLYAEEKGGFPDLPPMAFDAVKFRGRVVKQALDYRGDQKLGQFLDSLQLWRTILHRAHEYERKKVTPEGNRRRREPNKPMHVLFCTLNDVWESAFDEMPNDGWSPSRDTADSPYFRFLHSLFRAMHENLVTDVSAEYPQIAKDLKGMTPNAIRARFRATAQPKIKALARGWANEVMAESAKKK